MDKRRIAVIAMASDVEEMEFYQRYMERIRPDKFFPPPTAGATTNLHLTRVKEAKKPKRKRKPSLSPEIRAAVLLRDGSKCHFCKSTKSIHVHHMIPRSKGGTHDMENLLTVCELCHAWLHEGDPVHALMMKRQERHK